MKKNVTLFLLTVSSLFSVKSQVVLSEDFNSPFTLNAASGWTIQNNSSPTGTVSWFQGNPSSFFAYNGGPSDYYAVNFNSTTGGTGVISNWLISPAVTIYDGAVFQFATRVPVQGTVNADGLQLRMSTINTNVIPAGPTNVGSFTSLLLDINPNLTANTASVVSNGSVNGYPQSWTVYSVQISGVTGTVTGRFAFRYNVSANAGPTGVNGNFLGIDAVRYTLPCGVTAGSYTTCPGNAVTILTSGGLPSTTYLWSNSATTSSIAVTPTATTVYTLITSNINGPCPNPVTATVTLGANLSIDVSASANTVCAGRTVTLTASGAATYSWNTGGTSAIITVTPNTTTTYSVGGLSGNCIGGNTITITALALPSLSVASTNSISCPGTSLGLASSGAALYTWVLGTSAVSGSLVTITTGSNPAGGTFTVGIIGTDNNGCTSSGILTRTIAPSPSLTVVSSPSVQCVNKIASLSVTGANTYTWSGSTTSNSSSVSFSNGATAGPKSFTIAGTSTAGCTASTTLVYTVSACTGIQKINGNYLESSVFPNPFSSELTISGIVGHIEIYNTLGELILNVKTSENEVINTSNLTKGAYILRAYTDESDVRTIKIIKE